MGSVYLVQQLREVPERTPRDLTPVLRYGKLVILIEPSDNASINPEFVRSKVASRMKYFDPTCDHLAWIGGDPMGVVIVTAELLRRGITRFSWLRYTRAKDPQTGAYTDRPDYMPTWVDLTHPPIERAIPDPRRKTS